MYRKDGSNSATKVYNWENALIAHYGSSKSETTLDFKGTRSFANKVWNKYKNKFFKNFLKNSMYCSGINIKKVHGLTATAFSGFYRHRKNKYTSKGLPVYYKRMNMPKWAWNKPVILHEVAHLLAPRGSGHNEDFIGIYMYLLNQHCGYEYPVMVKTLNEVNLNFTVKNSRYLSKKFYQLQS